MVKALVKALGLVPVMELVLVLVLVLVHRLQVDLLTAAGKIIQRLVF